MSAVARNLVLIVLVVLPPVLSHARSGTGALYTAVGSLTLSNNSTGEANTAVGYQSLFDNTTGGANTGIGVNALFSNTGGYWNTAIGLNALYFNTTASWNSQPSVRTRCTQTPPPGTQRWEGARCKRTRPVRANTAVGGQALLSNTVGRENTAVG